MPRIQRATIKSFIKQSVQLDSIDEQFDKLVSEIRFQQALLRSYGIVPDNPKYLTKTNPTQVDVNRASGLLSRLKAVHVHEFKTGVKSEAKQNNVPEQDIFSSAYDYNSFLLFLQERIRYWSGNPYSKFCREMARTYQAVLNTLNEAVENTSKEIVNQNLAKFGDEIMQAATPVNFNDSDGIYESVDQSVLYYLLTQGS